MLSLRGYLILIAGVALGFLTWGSIGRAAERRVWNGHTGRIYTVCFSPDGKLVASAGADGDILIRETVKGTITVPPPWHNGDVYAIAFSPDGKLLASAAADGLVRTWDVATGREVRQFKGHKEEVAAVAFSPNGKTLASGGYDGMIRLWETATGKEVRRLEGHDRRVTAVAFSPDGKQLASGGIAHSRFTNRRGGVFGTGQADVIRVWDLSEKGKVRRLSGRGKLPVAFSSDGKTVAGGGLLVDIKKSPGVTIRDGLEVICLVQAATGETRHQIKGWGKALAFSPNGKVLASGSGALLHFSGFGVMAPSIANSRNTDERVRLWDVASAKELLRLPQKNVTTLVFSPDGKVLATGNDEGAITLWDLEAEKRNPTPDPDEIITPPPPGDKLLVGLAADFQELLKKEKSPEALREANRLLNTMNVSNRMKNYLNALAILRQQRSKAGIPLVLRYLVEHADFWNADEQIAAYVDTLVILTGDDMARPSRDILVRKKPVREVVQKLVDTWWRPNKKRIVTDLGRMSKEQLRVVADRLVKIAIRGFQGSDFGGPLRRASSALSFLWMSDEGWSWWSGDLHPVLLPWLLASAGYSAKPAKPHGWENHPIPYATVSLLAALRKKGQAPALEEIAADKRQNSATRLTCLLALHRAGEPLPADSLLPIVQGEKRLERRLVAILCLSHCGDLRAARPLLIQLLNDENVYVRGAAVRALATIKPAAALPKLKKLLDDDDPRQHVDDVLDLVGTIGTEEAKDLLADVIEKSLEGKMRSRYLSDALSAFEQATGRHWTEAGRHPEAYYRQAARKALKWWKNRKALRQLEADVEELARTWWLPNKEKEKAPNKMSREQLRLEVERLLKPNRDFADDLAAAREGDPFAIQSLLYSILNPDGAEPPSWRKEELYPVMVPVLLELAGLAKGKERLAGEDKNSILYEAIPLLAALRSAGEAPGLERIADDNKQSSATRLVCLLALYGAGERLKTQSLVSILKSEKKVGRRVLATLVLAYSQDRKGATAKLVELLDDAGPQVRTVAVLALGDRPATEALPKLTKILEEKRPDQPVGAALRTVAAIGTKEARNVLGRFLEKALRDPDKRRHDVDRALSAFADTTGQRWTEAGAHDDAYYRAKAAIALAWWKKQKD